MEGTVQLKRNDAQGTTVTFTLVVGIGEIRRNTGTGNCQPLF